MSAIPCSSNERQQKINAVSIRSKCTISPEQADAEMLEGRTGTPTTAGRRAEDLQNFSIRFLRAVHMRARLPKMYIGMVKSKHASCMPPMMRKTSFEPSDSSHCVKKSEKTRPWKMSVAR